MGSIRGRSRLFLDARHAHVCGSASLGGSGRLSCAAHALAAQANHPLQAVRRAALMRRRRRASCARLRGGPCPNSHMYPNRCVGSHSFTNLVRACHRGEAVPTGALCFAPPLLLSGSGSRATGLVRRVFSCSFLSLPRSPPRPAGLRRLRWRRSHPARAPSGF